MFAKLCPFKHQQAEVNRGGIKRIDMTVKLKDLINSALACPIYHECSVFLKEAIGTPFSCFAKIAPCYRLPDPEMIEFSGVSHHRHDEILEALTVEKLAEHGCEGGGGGGRTLDILVAFVFTDKIIEMVAIHKLD